MKTPSHPTIGLRHLVLALAAIAMSAPLIEAQANPLDWMFGQRVEGSGTIKKQTRETGHFTGVSLGLSGNVEIRIGATEGVVIETDDNLLPLVETMVEDGTLKIRTTKKGITVKSHALKVIVNAREIDHLSLGGSGTIDADTLHAQKMRMDIGGAGTINIKNIEADVVTVSLGGKGELHAGGAAHKVQVSIGGSGIVDTQQLKADDVSVSIGGSGEAIVSAKDSLTVSIAGSGDVNYYGNPKVSKSVAGSGDIKRLGDAPH